MIRARRIGSPGPGSRSIVLLHGVLATAEALLPLAARLASHTAVYVPELPGARVASAAGVLSLTGEAGAWLAANSIRGAVVAGFGRGAALACALALAQPDSVGRLVLIGPGDRRAYGCWAARLRAALDLPFVGQVLRRLPLATRAAFRALELEPLLERIEVPALVIRGDADPLCSHARATHVAARLPDATLRSVPGLSHDVGSRGVAELERVIADWLDETPAAPVRMHAVSK